MGGEGDDGGCGRVWGDAGRDCGGEGGGWGQPIRITDRQTGKEVAAEVDDDHNISGPVFSGDGGFVAAAGYGIEYEGYVYIWELQSGRVQVWELRSAAHAVAFSPGGRRIATGYSNGLIEVLTRATAKGRTSFSAHDESIALLAFSPDGKRIASITSGGCLRVWDPAAEPPNRKPAPHPDALAEAVFSPKWGPVGDPFDERHSVAVGRQYRQAGSLPVPIERID